MSHSDRLRSHSDTELLEIAAELQARAEEFSAETRLAVNDELRRRRLPTIGVGRSRH